MNKANFCQRCGKRLIKKDTQIEHYDSETGEPIRKTRFVCPTLESSFRLLLFNNFGPEQLHFDEYVSLEE